MRGTSQLQCIVPTCENQATEISWFINQFDEVKKCVPLLCVCHVKGHTLRVKEYSNAYSLIECETSTCGYEERVEVAVGCKDMEMDKKSNIEPNFHLEEIMSKSNDCFRCGIEQKLAKSDNIPCTVYSITYKTHLWNKDKQVNKCQCGCTMTMPHSHLVKGYSCPCEQGLTNPTL